MEESARKSFLDIVRQDLTSDRSSFLTRFVYIGEYNTSDSLKLFKSNVKDLHQQYGESLTGLLLLYPKFFLHLIEGSEENIYKHLTVLFASGSTSFGRVVALPAYYNGLKIYFPGWFVAQISNPPLLLDKICSTEFSQIQKHMQNCLLKMYSLCQVLTDAPTSNAENIQETVKNLDTTMPHLLPEFTVIEYLLSIESKALQDMKDYLLKFHKVPLINLYNDRVWPPTRDFVPRNLLLSKEKTKKA